MEQERRRNRGTKGERSVLPYVWKKGAFNWSFVLGMAFAEGSANDWLPIVMVDGHEQSIVAGSIMYAILY